VGDHDRNIPVLSIGVVQELTGLSGRQIRYYEQAGLLSPRRTGGRRRLYTRAEVDLLHEIKEYLQQGMTLEAVKELLRAKGRLAPTALADRGAVPEALPGGPAKFPAAEPLTQRMPRLTSLYPVNNQAGLVERLRAHQEEEERK
jgi:MerR family glutamine synthetase transcriptional repressor